MSALSKLNNFTAMNMSSSSKHLAALGAIVVHFCQSNKLLQCYLRIEGEIGARVRFPWLKITYMPWQQDLTGMQIKALEQQLQDSLMDYINTHNLTTALVLQATEKSGWAESGVDIHFKNPLHLFI